MNRTYVLVAVSIVALLAVSAVSAFGFGNGFMNSDLTDEEKAELQEEHQQIQTAVKDGDYSSWANLMQSRISKMQAEINEENFQQIRERQQEMSQLRTAVEEAQESGDWSEVEALKEKLGIEGNGMGGKGMGKHGMKMGSENGLKSGEGNCPFADSE